MGTTIRELHARFESIVDVERQQWALFLAGLTKTRNLLYSLGFADDGFLSVARFQLAEEVAEGLSGHDFHKGNEECWIADLRVYAQSQINIVASTLRRSGTMSGEIIERCEGQVWVEFLAILNGEM